MLHCRSSMDLNTDEERLREIVQREIGLHDDRTVVLGNVLKKVYDEELANYLVIFILNL